VTRRHFLSALAAALALPAVLSAGQHKSARKNWAWLRGDTTDTEAWKRSLAALKAAGFDAVLISGDAAFYRTHVPVARDIRETGNTSAASTLFPYDFVKSLGP